MVGFGFQPGAKSNEDDEGQHKPEQGQKYHRDKNCDFHCEPPFVWGLAGNFELEALESLKHTVEEKPGLH